MFMVIMCNYAQVTLCYIRESVDPLRWDGAGLPILVYIGKPAKLPRARVLSLPKHMVFLFQHFSDQRYPPSS